MSAELALEVLSALGGAASTTKTILDTIRAAKASIKNGDMQARLESALAEGNALQTRLFEIQEKVASLNRTIIHLESENAQLTRKETDLREEIRRKEEGASERQKYQRKAIGKSVVMVRDDEPQQYFCPTCFEKTGGKGIPIQPYPPIVVQSIGFTHHCASCKTDFSLK